nr:MAG TPA: SicP binding protein [Caudoviricetes sp.]
MGKIIAWLGHIPCFIYISQNYRDFSCRKRIYEY